MSEIKTEKALTNTSLPKLSIPKGVCAKFDFSGKYGDVLAFMHWVYFALSYYLPIKI